MGVVGTTGIVSDDGGGTMGGDGDGGGDAGGDGAALADGAGDGAAPSIGGMFGLPSSWRDNGRRTVVCRVRRSRVGGEDRTENETRDTQSKEMRRMEETERAWREWVSNEIDTRIHNGVAMNGVMAGSTSRAMKVGDMVCGAGAKR